MPELNILNEQFWYITPESLQELINRVHSIDLKKESFNPELIAIFGEEDVPDAKPYKMESGIAVIDIHGRLVKRASGFMAWLFGIVGTAQIGEMFNKAIADPDVKGVFLDVDSPGGSVDGTSDLADIIYEARGKKPILAFADGQATSAAAWISTSADFVAVANESTTLGSVGVLGIHLDIVDRAKELGIRPTVFSAGKFKAIGNEFEHLSKDDKKYIQGQFDYLHGLFLGAISKNIGIPENKLDSDLKQAKIFMGSQGINVGLAHAIMNKKQAMALLSDVADGKTTFDKHKTKMELIKLQGGDNKMDLEARIKELEAQLKNAQDLIAENAANGQVAELNTEITRLKAEIVALQTTGTENATVAEALNTEIETLKADAESNTIFVSAGKSYIDGMKAEIKKTSVQVDGDAYNEGLVDKQLEAFGNDIDMLSQFKASLDARRSAMIKTGEIVPDAVNDNKSADKTAAEEYAMGANIIPKHMRIVK